LRHIGEGRGASRRGAEEAAPRNRVVGGAAEEVLLHGTSPM